MNKTATQLKTAAVISGLLVLPLVLLEMINRRRFDESFPLFLFAVLWLLPAIFILTLLPLVRSARDSERRRHPASLLARIAVLVLLGAAWVSLMGDQMPCFLGVANCD
jgi:cation transport ATPase